MSGLYQWDPHQSDINDRKQGIDFAGAKAICSDELGVDFDVSRVHDREMRRKVVGMIGFRLVAVVYTRRGEAIRIVSARPANTPEIRRHAAGDVPTGS